MANEPCKVCGGLGEWEVNDHLGHDMMRCNDCNGTGKADEICGDCTGSQQVCNRLEPNKGFENGCIKKNKKGKVKVVELTIDEYKLIDLSLNEMFNRKLAGNIEYIIADRLATEKAKWRESLIAKLINQPTKIFYDKALIDIAEVRKMIEESK
jgi:RecJ-like exonuclease